MNGTENPKQKFSKVKADLNPGEFDEIVNYRKIKRQVLENRAIVMNSEIAQRKQGIFRFPNF